MIVKIKDIWRKIRSKKNIHAVEDIDLKVLQNVFILKRLSGDEESLKIFTSYCYVQKVAKGKEIYIEGEPSSEMYIILSGAVRIYKRTSDGEQFLLTELKGDNGDFFGEVGLIQEQKRSASVQTATETELLVLSLGNFQAMIKNEPSIAVGLIFSISQVLIDRLQKTNADLAYLCDALSNEISSEFLG